MLQQVARWIRDRLGVYDQRGEYAVLDVGGKGRWSATGWSACQPSTVEHSCPVECGPSDQSRSTGQGSPYFWRQKIGGKCRPVGAVWRECVEGRSDSRVAISVVEGEVYGIVSWSASRS